MLLRPIITAFFLLPLLLSAQTSRTGVIDGRVTDQATHQPLVGATVAVQHTSLGTVTDTEGRFSIRSVPVGNHILEIRMIGYAPVLRTDIIVRPERNTSVTAELEEQVMETDQVVVTAGYFPKHDESPVSLTALSAEEIRRAPGSGGDISRVVMSLPSIAKVNDQSNGLIVRGGSPLENAFFLDGIEVPNINHFPSQSGSAGPIGMITIDLIDGVQFTAGGFAANTGDRMSSVMMMTMREGNREQFAAQADLNIAGFGGVVEGPLGDHASYLFSVRRSYLDALASVVDLGTSAPPRYGDLQGKISWDLSPSHRLTAIVLAGDDHNSPSRTAAIENDMVFYGDQDILQAAGGIAWRALWSDRLTTTTSLGVQRVSDDENLFETNTGSLMTATNIAQTTITLRSDVHLRVSEPLSLEFGIEARSMNDRSDEQYGALSGPFGTPVPASAYHRDLSAQKYGGYLTAIVRPIAGLTATIGARTDASTYDKSFTASPRASLSYTATGVTTFSLSGGMYHQRLPLAMLEQAPNGASLRVPYAVHYIAGVEHLLTDDLRLSVEAYQKEYYDMAVDPSEPSLFLMDETIVRNGMSFSHALLSNGGAARTRGVEVTLQKKLAEELYGLVSASLFHAQYRGADGTWRNRVYDNIVVFSAEGGYKPNEEWEFSARWIYAGGTPYTPLDLSASASAHREVLDGARVNGVRYPAYHSLNVRFDKRFHFERSNLVFYLSAWNAYNRKNVAGYVWDDQQQKQKTLYQWNLLPIFGVEYEL